MRTEQSHTNESFNFLKKSDDFLSIILDNISSCVLLLDKNMNLHAFNNALKTIFSSRKDEDLLFVKCGEAIGCAYQVEEEKECGSTTQCNTCELKETALESYAFDKVVYKDHIVKPFYTWEKEKVDKHLQFSTRVFNYRDEKYVLMIVDDITSVSGIPQH